MRWKPVLILYGVISCSISFLLILTLFQVFDSQQSESDLMKSYALLKSRFENLYYQQPKFEEVIEHADKGSERQSQFSSCFLKDEVVFSDVESLRIYDSVDFTSIDGGVWKQGWNIEYNVSQWSSSNKLKVFLVPHSHNDPGWLKTFEHYFESETKHILDGMVDKLSSDKRGKFIWAEMSYLSLWWKTASQSQREAVKKFVASGQLEIVTGGWVMTDEANSHYYSMIEQLLSGHEWLKNTLGVMPKNGWSIDPFGLSPTMAYVLKESGLKHMLVQRVHYIMKKYLAKRKNLEFFWRQIWDSSGETNILTHMMPFYSYDVPHTCGPDPKICCQFDFIRGFGKFSCPWGINPQEITEYNIEERALTLLDQYRKKSQLFRTSVLLVPLGDDFRYQDAREWNLQLNSYSKLFDFLNNQKDLHVEAKIGTLDDYFNALEQEILLGASLPSLTGDFFTYADRDDHYWSGYYSSRPFYKSMERELLHYLRAAELCFTAMAEESKLVKYKIINELYQSLMSARHTLSLFQHHDGITGTAKSHVVDDYADKKWKAILACQEIIREASLYLLGGSRHENVGSELLVIGEIRNSPSSLPISQIAQVTLGKHYVVIMNPSGHSRSEVVTVRCDSHNVIVEDSNSEIQDVQVSPVFQGGKLVSTLFDITFSLKISALGLKVLKISHASTTTHSKLATFLSNGEPSIASSYPLDAGHISPILVLSTKLYDFNFDHGFLTSFKDKSTGKVNKLAIGLVKYGTTNNFDKSGAYLFLPDGPALPLTKVNKSIFGYVGSLKSKICSSNDLVEHCVIVSHMEDHFSRAIKIENIVDIRSQSNFEVAMRIETDIQSGNVFYTDLNGHQIIKRKTQNKLPLQGNFYPLPMMGYIEDNQLRMTLMTKQPQGCSSLSSGQFEVIMDRMLAQDDNRGLGQPVLDSVPLLQQFVLLIEPVSFKTPKQDNILGLPSLLSSKLSFDLLHPSILMHGKMDSLELVDEGYRMIPNDLPCDIQLEFMRVLPSNYVDGQAMSASQHVGVVFHKYAFECEMHMNLSNCQLSNGKVIMNDIFPDIFANNFERTTLTFLQTKSHHYKTDYISLHPLKFKSFIFHIS